MHRWEVFQSVIPESHKITQITNIFIRDARRISNPARGRSKLDEHDINPDHHSPIDAFNPHAISRQFPIVAKDTLKIVGSIRRLNKEFNLLILVRMFRVGRLVLA